MSAIASPRRPAALGLARLGIAAAGLAVLASGCGQGANGLQKQSGPAIIRAAGKALAGAHSFQIRETLRSKGNTESLTFDVEGANQGGGTFKTTGLSFQAKELAGVDYFRSGTLWNQVGGSSLQKALGDKWVYVAASSPIAAELSQAFTGLTAAKGLAAQLTAGAKGAVRHGLAKVDGVAAVAVSEKGAGTVYVATHGSPYPVRWDHSSQGTAEFSDFGKKFGLKKPAKALSLEAILTG